jgi:hypothetical protein
VLILSFFIGELLTREIKVCGVFNKDNDERGRKIRDFKDNERKKSLYPSLRLSMHESCSGRRV